MEGLVEKERDEDTMAPALTDPPTGQGSLETGWWHPSRYLPFQDKFGTPGPVKFKTTSGRH